MTNWRISLFEPEFTQSDIDAMSEPLRRGWVSMGEEVRAFEEAFQAQQGARHALAVSSCTAALHLALLALEVGPGDEVLLPSLTFVACANVVRQVGAQPVFVDLAHESDWTLSPHDLAKKITPRSKAVMVMHYGGFACNMEAIGAVARKHELAIIEDCAHALITRCECGVCGNIGDVGCFSFFTNKNMTTAEGGMLVTQRDDLAQRFKTLRSHGMTTLSLDRYQGRAVSYDVTEVGLNYRMDEMRGALGRSQLARLPHYLERRAWLRDQYLRRLKHIDSLHVPFVGKEEGAGIHIMPVALPHKTSRQAFIAAMKEQGVQTSIHYPPIHQFSAYQNNGCAHCPMTEDMGARQVTLPFFPAMQEEQVALVCEAVENALTQATP